MGIAIHYQGKAKSAEAIDELIDVMREMGYTSGWRCRIIDEKVKGEYESVWGKGYRFIPSPDRIQKEGSEFFPKMISKDCNGYFQIFHTRYQNAVRTAFESGKQPTFLINTRRKGIQLSLHPQCGNLNFIFDMKTLELIEYTVDSNRPDVIYGIEGFSCKTQFAGFEIHQIVCRLLKLASHYIDFSDIDDESGFYDSDNLQASKKYFDAVRVTIAQSVQSLKKMGMDVKPGNEF